MNMLLGVNVSEIEAPFELKDRSRSELVADVREKLGTIVGANVEIGQPISHRIDAMLSGTKANIAIKLFGDDLNRMFSLGNEIKNSIQDIPGIADLNVEQQIEERPQAHHLAQAGSTCQIRHLIAGVFGIRQCVPCRRNRIPGI